MQTHLQEETTIQWLQKNSNTILCSNCGKKIHREGTPPYIVNFDSQILVLTHRENVMVTKILRDLLSTFFQFH